MSGRGSNVATHPWLRVARPCATRLALALLAACSREPAEAVVAAPGATRSQSSAAPPVESAATVQPAEAGPAEVKPDVPTPPAAAAAVVPTPPATAAALVVAGPEGVLELDLDGVTTRRLSATPGRSPRWLPGRTELVFLATKGGRSRELRALKLADASERVVARIPAAPPCPRSFYAAADEAVPTLDVQNEADFWVRPDGTHACLELMDHEADLVTVMVGVAVDLHERRARRSLRVGGEDCGATQVEGEVGPPCDLPPAPPEPTVESPFERVAVHSTSRSGRWLLLRVREVLHDVLHRQMVLYDRDRRRSYPLRLAVAGAWPEPVTVDFGAGLDAEALLPELPEVGGAAAITWVGERHLVIERTLFIAGERVVVLPGDVALGP